MMPDPIENHHQGMIEVIEVIEMNAIGNETVARIAMIDEEIEEVPESEILAVIDRKKGADHAVEVENVNDLDEMDTEVRPVVVTFKFRVFHLFVRWICKGKEK
jgi:hypothetical protein